MTEVAVSMPHNPSDRGFGTPGKGSHSAGRSSAPDNNTDPRSNSGRPIKVDNKKRKKIYEQNAMLQLSEVRLVKKKEIKLSKENARKILRKIPIELLARDWLNESQATVDIRAYMVDNVFPTLILGVEKLLTEVDSRQLASDEINGGYSPNFNPVNYLAQYLMRNNPRYSNFSEASPYVRGLRQIAEELKAELFDMEDNRLARIKKEAKHKREGRELQAQLKQQETERRQKVFMTKFAEWNVTTDNNQVELSLLQNTLRSFIEVTEQFPAEVQDAAKYGHPLEPTDETGRTLSLDEFAQYLSFYVENLPSDVFEEFMVHMAKCAMAYRAAADREYRRIALTNLFIQCDHSGIGQLDRHRILNLFEQIWDTYKDSKRFFHNPRKWPVVEVDEADDSFSDEEDDVPALLETMAPAQSLEISKQAVSFTGPLVKVEVSDKQENTDPLHKVEINENENNDSVKVAYVDSAVGKEKAETDNKYKEEDGSSREVSMAVEDVLSAKEKNDSFSKTDTGEKDKEKNNNASEEEKVDEGRDNEREDPDQNAGFPFQKLNGTAKETESDAVEDPEPSDKAENTSEEGHNLEIAPGPQPDPGSELATINEEAEPDDGVISTRHQYGREVIVLDDEICHTEGSSKAGTKIEEEDDKIYLGSTVIQEAGHENTATGPVVEVDEADDSFSDEEDDVPALLETMAPAQSLEISKQAVSFTGPLVKVEVSDKQENTDPLHKVEINENENNDSVKVAYVDSAVGKEKAETDNKYKEEDGSSREVSMAVEDVLSAKEKNDSFSKTDTGEKDKEKNNNASEEEKVDEGRDNEREDPDQNAGFPFQKLNGTAKETESDAVEDPEPSDKAENTSEEGHNLEIAPGPQPDPGSELATINEEAEPDDGVISTRHQYGREVIVLDDEICHTEGSSKAGTKIEEEDDKIYLGSTVIQEAGHENTATVKPVDDIQEDKATEEISSQYQETISIKEMESQRVDEKDKDEKDKDNSINGQAQAPADISGSQESSYALNSQGESSQYLHETSLNLPNSSQSLPKSSENLPNSSQNLPNSSQNLPKSSQNLPKSSQNLPNSLQNLPNSSQNLPNSSQNLPGASQNLPNSSQNLPNSSQNLPCASQNLPGASQNLPGASQNLPVSTLSSEMFLLEAGTEYGGVTFAEGTSFERQRTNLTTASANRSQSQLSAFDESSLNVSQFVQLTENFLGENPIKAAFEKLVTFIREGYEETEDEKMERLMKAHKEAISASHKAQLDALFEKWDNDGCGYLDLTDVEEVMLKYKEGQEKNTIAKAQEELKNQSKFIDARLNKQEFRNFVTLVIEEMPGDSFEYFVEFLTNSVERSYAERVRGEARKKWLQMIINAAETSGISLESVYKAVFQALYRDAETHGSEKRISANIALLERNTLAPQRGDVMLRYTACTPEDANYVFQKILFRDMKGISFAAVDSGKPVHVPRVSTHGNIQFWNTDRTPEEREGSFIVVPLKDRKKRVFGVLGIDTLCNTHGKAIFITHEIQFFQGVAQTFSIAYHLIDMRRKLLRITESAISWIKRRAPQVTEIMVYMVEPGKSTDFVLRRMMTTDKKGFPVHIKDPPVRLERKDNLFRDYLFKCVDNSETVTADAYGNRHLAFPLRDNEGKAIALVDINIGHLRKLPAHENKETQRMLRLLQQAHREITQEFAGEDKMLVLDAEKDDDTRMEIMFDRLMLMELRENVSKLDSKAWAELRAYNSPPEIVLHILRASLSIFYPELTTDSEFDNWSKIRSYINGDLIQKVQTYDPTLSTDLTSSSVIEEYLKDVPHGEVTKHGSLPAQYLYNWVFVCLSLIDHTRKMRQNQDQELLPVTKPSQTAVAEVKSDTDIL